MLPERIAHYRILEKLGEGGMGVVYRAEDEKVQRQVAIKLLCIDHAGDEAAVERFHREARIASSVSHRHVCAVYEFGDHAGSPYMVMELLDGQTLRELMNGKPLELDRLLEIAIQVADGMHAAHESGIVHRDIKSTNILITQSGEAKVLDFGLAKFCKKGMIELGQKLDPHHVVSVPGLTVGTVTYMSPEQVAGKDLDRRSDIFSLGIVLYEMATGMLPFHGGSSLLVMQAILYKTFPRASQVNRELPAEFDRILNRALEKDRERRYQSLHELRADLERLRRDAKFARLPSDDHGGVVTPQVITSTEASALPAPISVVEPWDSIAREGRDFAERGSGIMYWFRIPLGGISHPGGFRSTLQPALENRRITKIRFILDSTSTSIETWRSQVVPLVLAWGKRTRQPLRLDEDDTHGRFCDPHTERTLLSWLFTDLSADFSPSFKIFVDDADGGVSGLAEAEMVIATTTRSVRLANGNQQTVRVPDTLMRARASADQKLFTTLRSVARRWDFLLP
jgi:serine/threonine protein kinase